MADHIDGSGASSFGVLYFFRAGFSVAWVATVSALASPAAPAGPPGVLAGILLICYPVSDAVATAYDLRAHHTARARRPQQVNLVAGVAAAQYSAGGAPWYMLAGLWLLRSPRPSAAEGNVLGRRLR